MTRYFLFWVGLFLAIGGASLLTYLVLSYRIGKKYHRKGGSDLHPKWLWRETTGSVYSSRNDRQS
jgi:hypothetical protein